jgi:hypothetical protein
MQMIFKTFIKHCQQSMGWNDVLSMLPSFFHDNTHLETLDSNVASIFSCHHLSILNLMC